MPSVFNFVNNSLVNEAISTSTKTLDEGDNGVAQVCTATTVITLPATVAGSQYMIMNGAQGATAGSINISVSPAAADKIMGNGVTSADNKDFILTAGKYGDFIQLAGDGVNGYFVVALQGNWTREA